MSLHVSTLVAASVPLLWLYLLFGRGGFWRVQLDRREPLLDGKRLRIAAVVPARNEADVIARSSSSLLQQEHVDLHLFLIDDNSTDGTAQIAHSVHESSRMTVISGRPLPAGWSGKLWAVQQGIEAARAYSPEYFLFTDADIEHGPGNIARLLAIAEQGQFDLASFMVKLHCATLAEKLLIPAFVFFFFKLYPPRLTADPHSSTAGAAGGCILIRPSALARAGGLESISAEIIDDCSLADGVKRSGGKVWLGLTDLASSIRPYRTFREVEHMIARTAFNQLQHSALLLGISVLGLSLIYIAPLAFLAIGSPISMLLGGVAFALMMTAYIPMVRFYGLNPLWALSLPFVAIFYMGATVHSAINYWLGRGGEWKGRIQDQSAEVPRAN